MPLPRRPYVTTRTHEVLEIAHDLAEQRGHDDVTPVHVALGLILEGKGLAPHIMALAVPLDELDAELREQLPATGPPRVPPRAPSWTPAMERIIDLATIESRELDVEYQGVEHVLLALLRDETSVPAQLLARHGLLF